MFHHRPTKIVYSIQLICDLTLFLYFKTKKWQSKFICVYLIYINCVLRSRLAQKLYVYLRWPQINQDDRFQNILVTNQRILSKNVNQSTKDAESNTKKQEKKPIRHFVGCVCDSTFQYKKEEFRNLTRLSYHALFCCAISVIKYKI